MNSLKLLRCNNNLSQLIYKNGQAGINKATVTLIFDNSDKKTSPIGYDDQDQLEISRTIFTNNTTKFTLNGHPIKLKSLHQLFSGVNLNIQTASFLIQQGKIASILSSSPKDILAQLQETAGTKMLEESIDEAQKELKKKDIRLKSIKEKIETEIKPKLIELQKAREIGIEINKMQKGIRGIDMLILIFDVISKTQQLIQKIDKQEKFGFKIQEQKNLIENLKSQEVQKQNEFEQLKSLEIPTDLIQEYDNQNILIAQQTQKVEQNQNQLNEIQMQINEIQRKILKFQQENQQNIKLMDQNEREVEIVQKLFYLTQQQTELIQKIDLLENNVLTQDFIETIQGIQSEIKNFIKENCFKEQNQNPTQFSTKLQELKSEVQVELEIDKNRVLSLQNAIQEFQQQSEKQSQEEREMNRQYQILMQTIGYQINDLAQKTDIQAPEEQNFDQIKKFQQNCKRQISTYQIEFDKQRSQFIEGPKKFNSQKNQLFNQFAQRCQNKNYVGIASMIRQIPNQVKNQFTIAGLVIDQIQINQNLQQIANENKVAPQLLLSCAEKISGGRLFNIISGQIQNSQQFIKSQYCTKRCTILALDNMQFQQPDERRQQFARQNGGIIVTDILQPLPQYRQVINSLLGNLVICQNIQQAKEIAYNKQSFMRCITYQGDIVDPSGVVTGGSRLNQESFIQSYIEYNQLQYSGVSQQQLQQQEHYLKQLQNIYQNFQQNIQQYQQFQYKLQNSQTQKLEQEIKQCQYQIDQLQQNINKQENKLNQYQIIIDHVQDFIQSNDIKQADQFQLQLDQITDQINQIKSSSEYQKAQSFIQQKEFLELQIKAKEQDIIDLQKQESELQEKLQETQKNLQVQTELKLQNLQKFTQTQAQVKQIKQQKSDAEHQMKLIQQDLQRLNDQIQVEIKDFKQIQSEYQKLESDQNQVQSQLQQQLQMHSELISLIQYFNNDVYQYILNNMKFKANQQIQFENLKNLIQNIEKIQNSVDFSVSDEKIVKQLKKFENQFQNLRSALTQNIEILSQQQPTSISITANLEELQQSSSKLIQMEQKIQEDKQKIEQLIEEVQQRKLNALEELYKQVNQALNSIYKSLIPNAEASLEKVNKNDITSGLYLKTNMSGMSGGQKSLLALSFTLALLKSRPSPLYILDEIDAALDLSMTDNIGQMISQQFAGSQFLVISLKEGLFTKANKIFRVQYKDGSSRVEIVK